MNNHGNEKKSILILFATFSVWQMVIMWVSSTTGYIAQYSLVNMPSMMNFTHISYAGIILGPIIIIIFPRSSLKLLRISSIVAIICIFLCYFHLTNIIYNIIFCILTLCAVIMTICYASYMIMKINLKDIWFENICEMILIAVFSLFLLNGKFDIPFVVYNTISLLILLCCTISYYVLNDKEMHYKQEPKSKVSRLFITFMFFTILLTMFSLTITTMLPQYYQNANIYIFFGQILTAFILEILRRKKVHFLNMIGVCFIIIVAGIVLFAIGKLLPIACILLGAASAISVLGIFIGGYVFSKYKSRFIPPLTIVLSGIAVGIGEMVYDYFAESLQIYMYIMMGIYVFAASIYLFLSPFIQYRMGYVIEVPFKDSDEKENLKNFEEIIIENDQKNIKESGLNVFSSLTEREKEVVKLILWGYTGNQIAATLFISLSTVKTHISNIYSKLLIKSKKELFDLARQGNSGDNMFPGQNF